MNIATSKSVKPHSVEHACVAIGVSRATLYKLINRGVLRTYQVGRGRRISENAIRECVEALEAETVQGAVSQ
jgi:excisionase family DNA binding protein